MIGHVLNGCTIVAAAPSGLRDTYVILAAIDDKLDDRPADPYVTASVHVRDMPAPSHWNNGHYFHRIEAAIEDFQRRADGGLMKVALTISDFLEARQPCTVPTREYGDREMDFLVHWEMNITATNPREAAQEAWQSMRRDHSIANVFDVFDPLSHRTRVDLEEPEGQ